MRFTLIKNLKKDSTIKPMLNGLLIFMLLYFAAEVFVDYSNFGLSYEQVKFTLFGDEENFLEPISQASFLEYIHTKIFFMMMILLTLSAVFIRLSSRDSLKLFCLNSVMISALTMLITLPLAYYTSPFFTYIYLLTYYVWHLCAFYMVLHSLWSLNFAKSI
ncbi:hypothetical protein LCX93_07125 [Sulfurimonas sp. SWIR-19]|uniref:hypothetical protein n=1 Tax=Sulfurimonas sp. SWIR-19 TaxID=2878390 RepID=UPI001CF23B00|nr:hypothetical protein [Sulfurimonas sp. SWIR-19]UCM99311.1 hypothetical protein LCX93_07125 [Sulfurimonas sp. SWIR-19]